LEALKIVRRGARLERAAAQNASACLCDALGGLHDLPLVFDRTRAGHNDEIVAADFEAVHAHARMVLPKLLADKLVRSRNPDGALDARCRFERFEACSDVTHTDDADHDALLALDRMHLVTELTDPLADMFDFFLGRMTPHRDDHFFNPS